VFSGLLKYDKNHRLIGDLAERWTLDKTEKKYTFHLRPNVRWHDDQPFTAHDVVFTFNTIKNSDVRSPLENNWRGIKVTAKGDHTVIFELPSIFGAFPYSLTVGILPKHILKDIEPDQLRSNDFNNIELVGTGPFKLEEVEVTGIKADERTEKIGLDAYKDYHFGEPRIAQFVLRTFPDDQMLIESFEKREIDAMVGLPVVPEQFVNDREVMEHGIPLTAEVLVFFRTSNDILQDSRVRNALVLASNRLEILQSLSYPLLPADSPLLSFHSGYNEKLVQKTSNIKRASKILDKAGWKPGESGVRQKRGLELKIKLYAQSNDEYAKVSRLLQKQWQSVGVKTEVILQNNENLQTTASLHNYDAILSAISIGPDPDVFAYWHSTQSDIRANTRLNFSEYRSETADRALESARSRTDLKVRSVKYQPFLKAWLADAPALALYQPRFLYIVRSPLYGFDNRSAVSATDRFSDVHTWMVREALTPKNVNNK
jgi:peptide/nickel transport system substrate-binding protein